VTFPMKHDVIIELCLKTVGL